MKFRSWFSLSVAAFCLVAQAFVFWLFSEYTPVSRDLSNVVGDAERGAYIAQISGCVGCHTNRVNGGGFLAGGAAVETAMGIFFPPNITSDKNAGIGLWDLKDFTDAVTLGVAPDGSHYYPAFPYWSYANLTDQDVADLWAAFKTTTPLAAKSNAHQVRFPVTDRHLLALWKRLDKGMTEFTLRPDRSEEWNRGAYLALGPGRCMACHAQGNFVENMRRLAIAGATTGNPLTELAPRLSAEILTERNWSEPRLVNALRSGTRPSGESFKGVMATIVTSTTSHMSKSDLQALATFLMWQPQ